jgi:rRNA biogenesis protein RRP5
LRVRLDPERSQVELTFRTKAAPEPRQKQLGFGQFSAGQKIDAVVKKVETFGIFLRIEDSNISGLCHKSELSDDTNSDVGKALRGFREGDKVKAVILTIDPEAKKISFGIKPSYFDDEDFEGSEVSDDEEEESDVEMADEDEGAELKFVTGDESDESDEDDDEVRTFLTPYLAFLDPC